MSNVNMENSRQLSMGQTEQTKSNLETVYISMDWRSNAFSIYSRSGDILKLIESPNGYNEKKVVILDNNRISVFVRYQD